MKTNTKQHTSAHTAQIVKIGTSRQVAIPKQMYDQLRLDAGDYLEVEVEKDRIVLTPKVFIEKRLVEGLQDVKEGKGIGPFSSGKKSMKALLK